MGHQRAHQDTKLAYGAIVPDESRNCVLNVFHVFGWVAFPIAPLWYLGMLNFCKVISTAGEFHDKTEHIRPPLSS